MNLYDLGTKLELMDKEKNLSFYVENDRLIATFVNREEVEVEVLTSYERQLLEKGEWTQNDIERKFFELKQIGVAGNA